MKNTRFIRFLSILSLGGCLLFLSASCKEKITYEKVEGVAPTCTSDGNMEYFLGSDGDYYQLIDDCYQKTDGGSVILPATGHDFYEDVCLSCGTYQQPFFTDGLQFTRSADERSFMVSAYTGTEQTVVIPDRYDDGEMILPVTELGANCFLDREDLTTLHLGRYINKIHYFALKECYQLQNIFVDRENQTYCEENGVLFDHTQTTLLYYPKGRQDKTYTLPIGTLIVGEDAFENCAYLEEIKLPNSIIELRSYAFNGCKNLKSMLLPENLEIIGFAAFGNCSMLTSITIPKKVKTLDSFAFYNCVALNLVKLSEGVETLGAWAFYGCNNLKHISLPDSIVNIASNVFEECNALTEISVSKTNPVFCDDDGVMFNKDKTKLLCYPAGKPESTYTIPQSVTTIGESAFYGCRNLTNIILPDTITTLENNTFKECSNLRTIDLPATLTDIPEGTFDGCERLQEVTIPQSVTYIDVIAFKGCKSLTNLTIPDGVTEITIGILSECSNLGYLSLPSGITNINEWAFYNCKNLTTIKFNGTKQQWAEVYKRDEWNNNAGNFTVICSDGIIYPEDAVI